MSDKRSTFLHIQKGSIWKGLFTEKKGFFKNQVTFPSCRLDLNMVHSSQFEENRSNVYLPRNWLLFLPTDFV